MYIAVEYDWADIYFFLLFISCYIFVNYITPAIICNFCSLLSKYIKLSKFPIIDIVIALFISSSLPRGAVNELYV